MSYDQKKSATGSGTREGNERHFHTRTEGLDTEIWASADSGRQGGEEGEGDGFSVDPLTRHWAVRNCTHQGPY